MKRYRPKIPLERIRIHLSITHPVYPPPRGSQIVPPRAAMGGFTRKSVTEHDCVLIGGSSRCKASGGVAGRVNTRGQVCTCGQCGHRLMSHGAPVNLVLTAANFRIASEVRAKSSRKQPIFSSPI